MDRSERVRRRDRNVSLVRRITLWVSAGSLATAAGVGALLGFGHAGTADTDSSATETTTPTTDATPGATSDSGDGFQQPRQPPGGSGGSGGVTSGGS